MKTQKGKKISLEKFTIAKIKQSNMNTVKGGSYTLPTNMINKK